MRGIRTSIIVILVVGVLASSAVGVSAQEDMQAPASVTGTFTTPQGVSPGSDAWEDGALRTERQQMEVGSAGAILENEGGRWVGAGTWLKGADRVESMVMVMHGEDAYEGLTAYVALDLVAQTFTAPIFPGHMPPLPEPPAE